MTMNRKKSETRPAATFLPLIMALVLSLAPLPVLATEFVLLYSNDNVGEIEPCG